MIGARLDVKAEVGGKEAGRQLGNIS